MTISSAALAKWLHNQIPARGTSRATHLIAFCGYLFAQIVVVAGLPTPRYPDSAGYMQLSFTGSDLRLWTVPLLYRIVTPDTLRIAVQVLLAAFAWWFLADAASRCVQTTSVRRGLRIVLLALGIVGPIASWNSTILSDSVAISLTALLVGCWIRYFIQRSWAMATVLIIVTMFWSFTRNDLVVIAACVTAGVVVATLVRGRTAINIFLAAGLVVISAYGLIIDGRNPFVANANLADVIDGRILQNPEWTEWFVAHGMPYSTRIKNTEGSNYGLALTAIPAFNEWLTVSGTSTYLDFMVSHPTYTLWNPLPDFSGELVSLNWQNTATYTYTQPNPTPSMLSPDANYGRHRDVLPSVISDLLFEQGQAGDIFLLAFIAFGCAWIARRKLGPDRHMWLPLIVALSVIPQGYLVWLSGGDGETDRHAIVAAVTVRIGLWIVAGYALDRLLAARQQNKVLRNS